MASMLAHGATSTTTLPGVADVSIVCRGTAVPSPLLTLVSPRPNNQNPMPTTTSAAAAMAMYFPRSDGWACVSSRTEPGITPVRPAAPAIAPLDSTIVCAPSAAANGSAFAPGPTAGFGTAGSAFAPGGSG